MSCKLFLLLIPLCRPLSYGGAFGDLPFFPPVWITFRDGNLSLTVVSDDLLRTFSDGSFRLSARMRFMGIVDCHTCLKFPFAFHWAFLEVSNCKSFPEVFLGR